MRQLFLVWMLLISITCKSQDWNAEASRVCHSMIKNFWGASFSGAATQKYFNTLGAQMSMKNEWWWQAHAMDVIIDNYQLTGDKRYLAFYEPWYEGIIGSNYEYFSDDVLHNNSIDDMEWICITLIRMTQTTGDQRYYDHAKRLYERYIITTWGPDDEAPWHGGVSWSSDNNIPKTKNACSNGPAAIIASMLGKTDDVARIYKWERDNLFDSETGAVWDHIGRNGVSPVVHSYNTGTFIAMATRLYRETKDESLISDIIKAADYTINHFGQGDKKLMSLVSKRKNGGDAGLFHGIFFRYMAELINANILPADKQEEYRLYLIDNAKLALTCLESGLDIFSRDWVNERITAPEQGALTPHVTGATLIAAVASLK